MQDLDGRGQIEAEDLSQVSEVPMSVLRFGAYKVVGRPPVVTLTPGFSSENGRNARG